MQKQKRNLRKSLALLCSIGLLLNAAVLTGCDKEKVTRTLTASGYEMQVSYEALAKSAAAFNKRGRLAADKNRTVQDKVQRLSEITERFSKVVDNNAVITPENQSDFFKPLDEVLTVSLEILNDGKITEINATMQGELRRWVVAARFVAQGARVAIQAINTDTPTSKVLIDAQYQAQASKTAKTRGFTDGDELLIGDLTGIASDALAKAVAIRGKAIEAIRDLRKAVYKDVQDFTASQLG
jgi:hypothetical protein